MYTRWDNAVRSNNDAAREDHTERGKPEIERQTLDDITYMQKLKYRTDEPVP